MAAAGSPRSRQTGTRLALQLALAAAAAGSLIILLSLFGTAASVVGLALIVLGTVVSAPASEGGWWALLAAGTAISIAAALVQLGSNALGGLLAVIGGVLVLVAVSLGYPMGSEEE